MSKLEIVLSIIAIILIIITLNISEANERIRLYETEKGIPQYRGYAEKQINGTWRFYNKQGLFTGRMDKKRFYSKDGQTIEKYYLFDRK